jgi:hypothetical protein
LPENLEVVAPVKTKRDSSKKQAIGTKHFAKSRAFPPYELRKTAPQPTKPKK